MSRGNPLSHNNLDKNDWSTKMFARVQLPFFKTRFETENCIISNIKIKETENARTKIKINGVLAMDIPSKIYA